MKGAGENAYPLEDGRAQSIFILAGSVWATEQRSPLAWKREGECRIGQGGERSLSVTASLQRAQNHSNTVEQSKHTPPIFNFFH